MNFLNFTQAQLTSLISAINARAKLESPIFSGTPSLPTGTTAVTQAAGDSSTKISTTAFVTSALSGVGGVPKNSQTFTSSGTFTVPAGVTSIMVVGCGGGGGGGGAKALSGTGTAYSNGGAGSESAPSILSVTPSQVLTITIGAAGAGGSPSVIGGGTGGTGGDTLIGALKLNGAAGANASDANSNILAAIGTAIGGNSSVLSGNGTTIIKATGSSYYSGGVAILTAGGAGGAGAFGNGANGPSSATVAADGISAGSNTGAGGGGTNSYHNTTGFSGGNGGSGKVIIYW